MTRTNLIANPNFETDSTGWTGAGSATVARITSDHYIGTSCLQVTKAAATNSGAALSSRIAVTAGTSYAASSYVKMPIGSENGYLQAQIAWYTATSGGSLISTSTGSTVLVTTSNGWQRVFVIAEAPSLALGAVVNIVQPLAGTASKTFYADAVLFEASKSLNIYYDTLTQNQETTTVNRNLSNLPPPVFTGMKLNADIIINPITATDSTAQNLVLNTIDSNNTLWVCTDVKGWWTHPEIDLPNVRKGYGDGSYNVRGRFQNRQINVSGVIYPPAPEMLPAARHKLITATNFVYSGGWLVLNETDVPKASYVRLADIPTINTVGSRGKTEFDIPFIAMDPIKYSWNASDPLGKGYTLTTIADGSSAVINNAGNVAVGCYIEIVGSVASGAVITNTTSGEQINVTSAVSGGESLQIDTYERSVALNGGSYISARTRLETVFDWIKLQPGNNTITFAVPGTNAGYLNVYYRSGWVG